MIRYLLETDQVTCYAQNGLPISCDGTGQDAALPKTHQLLPGQRFVTGAHVVEDRLTGTVWTRDANPSGFPQTWHEALATLVDMRDRRVHGHDDWQLPSRDQLFSLVSHQQVNPSIAAGHPFENIFNGYYWTRDSCCRLPDQAWFVHLGGGRIYRGMKHSSYLVWPICSVDAARTSDPPPLDPFVVNADTVYDRRTGLTWTRDANPLGGGLTWEASLATVNTLNAQSPMAHRPWRLPNIRELESLIALDAHTPALPAGHPFVNIQDAYWSSTTSVYEPRYAWAMYARDGNIGVGVKTADDFFAWPVRST